MCLLYRMQVVATGLEQRPAPVLSPRGDAQGLLTVPRGQVQNARETGDVEGGGSATKHALSPAEARSPGSAGSLMIGLWGPRVL